MHYLNAYKIKILCYNKFHGWHDYILSGICIPGNEDKVQGSAVYIHE
jgi:hypothetical protein